MSHRPWRDIVRRKSRQIMVGKVPVGGDAPIAVQTMTNTPGTMNTAVTQIWTRPSLLNVRSPMPCTAWTCVFFPHGQLCMSCACR